MRLQKLNSPLSLYNNPALWPKIHLLHDDEKAVGNLVQTDLMPFYEPVITPDSIPSAHMMMNPPAPQETSPGIEQMLHGNNISMEEPTHGISSLIQGEHQMDGTLGNIYCSTPGENGFMPHESVQHHQMMLEFDCFEGILGDSSSWDDSSDSVDVQVGGTMFQGYETGYNSI
ncbi:hypothetical protein SAY86_014305 [Trapa natans]|uniref:Uncharacterized protein n=1 Tax=Trapa natans TaxID=22666 RepID=A0AAN7KT21_TRANT|nr:hypothetical protein SAY86_014305 [Trapa natans]